jgi:RecJ-like exonuclease
MALLRESTRVYLDTSRKGTITCLACGVKRSVNMSKYGDDIGGKTLNAQCRACTAIFRATFELRRHCRVHVHLPGRLLQLHTREEVEPIVVTSLSVTGLGFVTAPGVSVRLRDKYEVVFMLDDEDQSVLFEEIVITRVRGTRIGAAFSPSRYANHDLIFFVMSELSPL